MERERESFQRHDVYIKFHKNQFIGSKVITVLITHYDKTSLHFLRMESRLKILNLSDSCHGWQTTILSICLMPLTFVSLYRIVSQLR
jgi:hypothetical protein